VFFKWQNSSNAVTFSHVEIVYKVDVDNIYTIGGNKGNPRKVGRSTIPRNHTAIVAYATPNYNKVTSPVTSSASTQTVSVNPVDSGRIAQEIVRLVNIERTKAGLTEFEICPDLTYLAEIRATDLEKNYSHTRPNGQSATSYVVDNSQYSSVGENIAQGYNSATEFVRAWMNSSGHRENILRTSFDMIGVGVYQDTNGKLHSAQIFASDRASTVNDYSTTIHSRIDTVKEANEIMRLVNVERQKAGLHELEICSELTYFAEQRATGVGKSDTPTLTQFLDENGLYDVTGFCNGGASNGANFVRMNMNPPYSRQNRILNPNYTFIGAGAYQYSGNSLFCTILFR
jgi:uncharacterized protein YkwD